MNQPAPVTNEKRWRLAERAAHLGVLWAFAVAQPLFDLLGRNPEFFATRGSPRGDIVAFALVVALVPPVLLTLVEALAGRVSVQLQRALHLVLVAGLVAAIVLQAEDVAAPLGAFAIAGVVGAAAAFAYVRVRPVRMFLTVLSPAPLVFLFLFLVVSDVSRLVFPRDVNAQVARVDAGAPVVLVIFDEFPVTSLMDAHRHIDARLYPNFARLARDATWYRNTASVHQDTPYAVPAILDGRIPREDRLPVAADHPRSIFTLFGGTYGLHVREEATAICPPSICHDVHRGDFGERVHSLWNDLSLVYAHLVLPDDLERRLPSVTETWGDFNGGPDTEHAVSITRATKRATSGQRKQRLRFNLNRGRRARWEEFLSGIRAGNRRLHLIHVLLPHVPYQFLPSGRAYRLRASESIPGLNNQPSFGVEFLVEQSYQRHLLQVQATDRLLGELLDRLRAVGLYDHAVVAVVADHGVSFRRGYDRRLVRPQNVADIAPVPFFFKLPGQHHGKISDKPLQTVDVLPTIADALNVRIPWHVDGHSALAATVPAQRRRRIISKGFAHSYLVDTPTYERDKAAALRRKVRLFARGLYSIGPRPDLLGRHLDSVSLSRASGIRAQISGPGRYARVDPTSGVVPTHVLGDVDGAATGQEVAVAVNGTIEATGFTFKLAGSDDEHFSMLVPERSLHRGRNRVEVLLVTSGSDLEPIAKSG